MRADLVFTWEISQESWIFLFKFGVRYQTKGVRGGGGGGCFFWGGGGGGGGGGGWPNSGWLFGWSLC